MSNSILKSSIFIEAGYWSFGYVSHLDNRKLFSSILKPNFHRLVGEPFAYDINQTPIFNGFDSYCDIVSFKDADLKLYKKHNGFIFQEFENSFLFLPKERQLKTKFKITLGHGDQATITPYKKLPAQFTSHIFMVPIK